MLEKKCSKTRSKNKAAITESNNITSNQQWLRHPCQLIVGVQNNMMSAAKHSKTPVKHHSNYTTTWNPSDKPKRQLS